MWQLQARKYMPAQVGTGKSCPLAVVIMAETSGSGKHEVSGHGDWRAAALHATSHEQLASV
jgi:hypothetical protein